LTITTSFNTRFEREKEKVTCIPGAENAENKAAMPSLCDVQIILKKG